MIEMMIDALAILGIGMAAAGLFLMFGLGASLAGSGVMLFVLALSAARVHGVLNASDS